MTKLGLLSVIIGAMVVAATPLSLRVSGPMSPSLSVDKVDARVGRPATPASVAGVHRRTTRRGAAVGAAAGAAAVSGARAYCGYPPYPPCY